jgi:hypothetical protein
MPATVKMSVLFFLENRVISSSKLLNLFSRNHFNMTPLATTSHQTKKELHMKNLEIYYGNNDILQINY